MAQQSTIRTYVTLDLFREIRFPENAAIFSCNTLAISNINEFKHY